MEKIFRVLWIAVFFTLPVVTLGQPVLIATTVNPVPGDVFAEHSCDTNGISLGLSGPGIIWDYSALNTIYSDTIAFTSCTTTTYCDSATDIVSVSGGNYTYYKTNNNVFALTGSMSTICTQPLVILHFPFTYHNSSVDTALTYNTLPPALYGVQIDSTKCDAYGTLILPSGTFSHTIRIHKISYYTDSDGTGSNHSGRFEEYEWFEPHFHYPLLKLRYVTRVSLSPYLSAVLYYEQSGHGITEVTQSHNSGVDFNISPDPAGKEVDITFNLPRPEPVTITFSNISGQIVSVLDVNGHDKGINSIKYPVSELCNGMYFVHLRSANFNIVRKMVVVN